MNTYDHLQKGIPLIEAQINYTFKDKTLITLAFIHRSFTNENRDIVDRHNERLEFLGDAILGLVVSDFLYSHLPDHPEGELSYLRSRLVEAPACTLYLQKIDLERFLMVGKGEAMNEGKGRGTILADLFEAIVGAIYIDGGIEAARSFFFDHFKEEVLSIIEKPHRNWKAELQDYCQKKYQKPPEYKVFKEEGPDHLKTFYVQVHLDQKELGDGKGSSKKEAEQAAAEDAILMMEREKGG
ncbi:MAG: ribonuclease III [Chlamydiales bacterium]|nr:ribonuclease III [Chlamydiia bacterium]MCP5504884.1 ribonuclease III [Chlamydiales bacterium]